MSVSPSEGERRGRSSAGEAKPAISLTHKELPATAAQRLQGDYGQGMKGVQWNPQANETNLL